MCFFTHKHFSVYYPKDKDFLLFNNSVFIKIRKCNIDTALLPNPVVLRLHWGNPQLSTEFTGRYICGVFYILNFQGKQKQSKTIQNYLLEVVYNFSSRWCHIPWTCHIFGKLSFFGGCDKKPVRWKNQCETGKEGNPIQSDSKVWEVVQHPTGAQIPLVSNCD